MKEHDYQGVNSQGNKILRSETLGSEILRGDILRNEIFELEIEIVGGHHASYNNLTKRVW